MLVPERRQSILSYLQEKHAATVSELSRRFFISETSIRRDLTRLEKEGYVHKTYGGVILAEAENKVLNLDARLETDKEAKTLIASKAASLIQNGDVVFLDSSSTTLAMVPHLARFSSLTVVTNGAKIATALLAYPDLQVYCSGGQLAPGIFSYHGDIAARMIAGMHAGKAFISPKSIDPQGGVFCADEAETAIRRVMMERADETYLLLSTKKLARSATFLLCPLERASAVVMEQPPSDAWRTLFEESGVRML